MTTRKIVPNEQKFQELILYLADRCFSDPKFGAMKLEGGVGAVGEAVALDVAEDGLGAPPIVKILRSHVGMVRAIWRLLL